MEIRDAVSFGPNLIVNGKPMIKSGDGGGGIQPRTAIAQRQDGTVLFLAIDGRQKNSLGATLKDVQNVFLKYGAYNAANLDGGSSSTMILDNQLVNKPSDILGERALPSAFIIK
jgi:exopolysaccharide biosynthesis protein